MRGYKKTILAILLVAFLVFFDQWTKQLAVRFLSDGPFVLWKDVFELNLIVNHGIAFGLFQGRTNLLLILTITLVCLLIWLFYRIPEEKHFLPLQIVILFLTAGGIGNIIDRAMNSGVIDFFYFKLIDFPIFNVADIYATVSAFLLFFLGVFFYSEEDWNRILTPKRKEEGR